MLTVWDSENSGGEESRIPRCTVDSSLGDHDDDTDADVMVNDDGDDGDGDRLGIRLGRCCLLQRGETGTFFAIVLHGTLTAAVRSSTGAVWDVVGIPGGLESERRRAGGGTGKESNATPDTMHCFAPLSPDETLCPR